MNILPQIINPSERYSTMLPLSGVVGLGELPRLLQFLGDPHGSVVCTLNVSKLENGLFELSLDIKTTLSLPCQLCLENYDFPIAASTVLKVFSPEQESLITEEDFDSVITNGKGEVDLYDLITDELILSLPSFIAHPEGECKDKLIEKYTDKRTETRVSPFAVLKKKGT